MLYLDSIKFLLIFGTLTTVLASTEASNRTEVLNGTKVSYGTKVLNGTVESSITDLQYASALIDEQLHFMEHMIVTSLEYTSFSFLEQYEEFLKRDDGPIDRKRRLLLLQKCWSKVGDRMAYFLNKHNKIYRGYMDIMFPDGVTDLKTKEELRQEHVKFSVDMKNFFLNELPTYYHEYGRDLGVDFSQSELEEDLKNFKEMRERGTNGTVEFAKHMGVDVNHTVTHHNHSRTE